MSKWQLRFALVALYTAFALFVLAWLWLVASFTVIPMYQNYHDHGSIFLNRSAP